MLDLITKSEIRKKILSLLFSDKSKKFYLSEIAKKTSASAGSCQRELNKMVKRGILSTEKKNNLRFYFINKQNPLLPELEKIIKKTLGIEEIIRKEIMPIRGLDFAFIFGSYVQGCFLPKSDIDLFIIGSVGENTLIKRLKKLEDFFGREINYHLYSPADFKIKLKISSFLKNILKNYKLVIGNENEFKKLFK